MAEAPLVSVIIPTFNAAKFVADAVRSVLNQTYYNIEIHVVDDGSTDNTREVINAFASDARVQYHFKENGGVSSARNFGIRAARGQFIGLCDADDLWMPKKLELQISCFEGRPTLGVVYCRPFHVDVDNQPIETRQIKRYSGLIAEQLVLGNFVTGSTSLIRKSCFTDVGDYDVSLRTCEDYDLWLRISAKYEFLYLDEVTYRYRQWAGQVSVSSNEPQFYEDAIKVKKNFLKKNPELVSDSLRQEVWADIFSGRAQCIMRITRSRVFALRDIKRSLQYKMWRLGTWKSAIKVLINRVD